MSSGSSAWSNTPRRLLFSEVKRITDPDDMALALQGQSTLAGPPDLSIKNAMRTRCWTQHDDHLAEDNSNDL